MVCVSYLVALLLIFVVIGLLVYKAAHPQHNWRMPRPRRPFPWRGTTPAKAFDWSAGGWRFITWGGTISFLLVSFIAVAMGEKGGIARFIIGIGIMSAVLAAIAEGYFYLLKHKAAERSSVCAALACAWFIGPPLVLVAAFFALRGDAPKPSSTVASPGHHVTVVTKTGPFTETTEYDTHPNRAQNLVPALALVYVAVLGVAWLVLGIAPIAHAVFQAHSLGS